MPLDEPVGRTEFDAYILRHERDDYAHAPMRHDLRSEFVKEGVVTDSRLSALERWQQRIIGGLLFASVLLGSGVVVAGIEFLRH